MNAKQILAALCAIATVTACDGEKPLPEPTGTSVSETVGAGGGYISTPRTTAGGATLDVAPGALSSEETITIEPTEEFPEDALVVPGTVYEFGPDGLTFETPISLTIDYPVDAVPSGVDESDLRIHKVVGGAWLEVAGGTVDTTSHAVNAQLSGFSTYGVRGTNRSVPKDAGSDVGDVGVVLDVGAIPDMRAPDMFVTTPATCGGRVYACTNGLDDDADGVADEQDIDCTGPCDDDESSSDFGIPGIITDCRAADCYWDDNSGAGDDGCRRDLGCDPLAPYAACQYDPATMCGTQPAACVTACAFTPNGCDCFGCCEVYAQGSPQTVFVGDGCDLSSPGSCPACTPDPTCTNPCGECELCIGRTLADLAPTCFGDPANPEPTCDGGQACTASSDCAPSGYCLTGCCVAGT